MKPTPVALGLVRPATRLLPAGEARERYRWELFADLAALDRSHQLAYASGVLSTAWQLRRELTQEIDPMNDTTDPNHPAALPAQPPAPLALRHQPRGRPALLPLRSMRQGQPAAGHSGCPPASDERSRAHHQ